MLKKLVDRFRNFFKLMYVSHPFVKSGSVMGVGNGSWRTVHVTDRICFDIPAFYINSLTWVAFLFMKWSDSIHTYSSNLERRARGIKDADMSQRPYFSWKTQRTLKE